MKTNRTLVAFSAVALHISIGSVYAWSVFSKPLQEEMGWSLKEVNFTFGLAIFFLGISAAFLGHFVEAKGPRKAARLAAVLFGTGLIGAGFAIKFHSLWGLYLSYGVLGGMGLGVGYVAPVSTLVKWFPKRRGLATGLAIMGFGFAAAIASPVMRYLIDAYGVSSTFLTMGVIYGVVMLLASIPLEAPPVLATDDPIQKKKKAFESLSNLTANEALKTSRFHFLWFMLFINITCGIAIISVASPLAQEFVGLTATQAAAVVGLMGVFNGLGRIAWASLSDYIGRSNTYIAFFAIQIAAFLALPQLQNVILFQILLYGILTCYGGGFSSIPAFLSDIFGTKQLGAIHGYILTAWAFAGITGSTLMAKVKDSTGSYEKALFVFSSLFIVALIITFLLKLNIQKEMKKQALDSSETSIA